MTAFRAGLLRAFLLTFVPLAILLAVAGVTR